MYTVPYSRDKRFNRIRLIMFRLFALYDGRRYMLAAFPRGSFAAIVRLIVAFQACGFSEFTIYVSPTKTYSYDSLSRFV